MGLSTQITQMKQDPQPMRMFDKFHLSFNFKSKVSRDVFKNTKGMSIDIYISF